jgi:DNA-3-methyladenine glycosylase I
MTSVYKDSDNKPRCSWCSAAPEFLPYHDEEWGYPVDDDVRLFEKLCLESFQSGLSWRTILNKREGFRNAFKNFKFDEVANFDDQDLDRLLNDSNIVRHRGKIEAVINNATRAQEMIQREGSLAVYFWSFEPETSSQDKPQSVSYSDVSIEISKDLKKRGWKFVGPTTVYSFMQAMGLINDHAEGCFIRPRIQKAREQFEKPSHLQR